MAKSDFIPTTDLGKAALFERFRDTIGPYAGQLGLDEADIASQARDAAWFRYVLNHSVAMRNSSSQWTTYKVFLVEGQGESSVPVTPPLPEPQPPAVPGGIVVRFRALARRIKAAPGYSDPTGLALGIVGKDSAPPDLETLAPKISLRTEGGRVEVVWNKRGMDGVEIQKHTGDGWKYLVTDTRPNFLDPTDFPSPPQVWKYRASYIRDSQKAGQWSSVVEIVVGA